MILNDFDKSFIIYDTNYSPRPEKSKRREKNSESKSVFRYHGMTVSRMSRDHSSCGWGHYQGISAMFTGKVWLTYTLRIVVVTSTRV